MEDLAERYQGQVRFLYMYNREAHPIPETAPCGSTEELGWDHPSWDTISLEHRAQRARWLKEDFELTFPWIIDYMDRRITATYGGSGFYAGWVIDCDGRALVAERWGWATPQTQWCGLPLPAVQELTDFLDQYLADPPACYRGVDHELFTSVISTAAHLNGANQTTWRTNLTLSNPGVDLVQAEVLLLKRDQSNAGAQSRTYEIPSGVSLTLPDVVMSEFQFVGAAALLVESPTPIVVVSRTYNQTPDGTYGQWIPGIPASDAISGVAVGHLPMLEESQRRRTNLGLTSVSIEPTRVAISVTAADGSEIGDLTVDLDPLEHVQLNQFLGTITQPPVISARATVTVAPDTGAVLAYTSMVDNQTGDPIFVPAHLNSWSVDNTISAVAAVDGSNGTTWVSDVAVINASNRQLEASLHLDMDGDHRTSVLPMDPGESVLLQDVVAADFGTGGSGVLSIQSNPGLLAVSQTYNQGSEGDYGQFLPAVDLSTSAVIREGETAHLLQIEQGGSNGFRSNLGLVNLSDSPAIVDALFKDSAGDSIGSFQRQLDGHERLQINSVLNEEFGIPMASGVRAEIRLIEGGKITAYVSTVDNQTGDPVFQPAAKLATSSN